MATVNTFTSYASKDVGTTPAVILSGTADTQTTLIGLSCANTTSSPVAVDAYVTRSAVDYYLIKNATVPVGGSLCIVGGDQKVVIIEGDDVTVVASADTSVDVFASVLDILTV
jgi:hypothetical protein